MSQQTQYVHKHTDSDEGRQDGGRERERKEECGKKVRINWTDVNTQKKKIIIRFCSNAQLKPSAPLRDMEAYLMALPKTSLIPQMIILRFL